jgi:hypothetical protein
VIPPLPEPEPEPEPEPYIHPLMTLARAWEVFGMSPTRNQGAARAKLSGRLRRLQNSTGIGSIERRELEEAWLVICGYNGWKE